MKFSVFANELFPCSSTNSHMTVVSATLMTSYELVFVVTPTNLNFLPLCKGETIDWWHNCSHKLRSDE